MVTAFIRLLKIYTHDQLWLLGDEEPALDPLPDFIKSEIDNNPAIVRWGFCKDVRPYMAAADVLLFPSYREGFPNVPMQAAAMGCALIVSDINGCREIADDGKCALLVPPKNTEALFSAMLTIRTDEDLRTRLAYLARTHISYCYSQPIVWNHILQEYKSLLTATA